VITIELSASGERTPYHLGEGLLGQAPNLLQRWLGGRRAFVVSDTNVGPLYAASLAESLGAPLLTLPAGEEHKRWPEVENVVRHLLAHEAERGDLLVAVGGGVITDLVGFAAAVAMRGLPWVALPTTLLGMVDAAVGGKTGIDLDLGKNLVGAFWLPRAVIADPLVLATLAPRQLRAGLVEVVKAAMIAPSSMEHLLDSHLASVAGGDPLRAADLIGVCVRIKAEVVALDERESGPRKTLNLGHTLGHGLEAATRYSRFLHGEAVAWGLLVELRLARDRGLLSTEDAEKWAARIGALAPLPSLDGLSWEAVAPFIARDKKRTGGKVGWVLPRLGGVVLDVPISDDEAADVYAMVAALPPAGPFEALF
jgi:3-dehydroquinate synthetase